jgi:hypothetical protein
MARLSSWGGPEAARGREVSLFLKVGSIADSTAGGISDGK